MSEQIEPGGGRPFDRRLMATAMALLVIAVGVAYGYVITFDLPVIISIGLPVAGLTAMVGLWQPELLVVALLGITWGYISEVLVKFHGVPSVAKSLVVLMVVLVLQRRFFGARTPLKSHPLLWWMVGYMAVVGVGLWYAMSFQRTWLVVIDFAKELLLFFVVINLISTERWLERGAWAMLLVGAVLGGLTLYQEVTRNYGNDFGGFARSDVGAIAEGVANRARAGGPTSEPNAFGQQMLVLAPIGLWAALYARTLPARAVGGAAAFVVPGRRCAQLLTRGLPGDPGHGDPAGPAPAPELARPAGAAAAALRPGLGPARVSRPLRDAQQPAARR